MLLKAWKAWDRVVPLLAVTLAFIAVWDQSVNGRQELVQATRGRCYASAHTTALIANVLRNEQQKDKTLATYKQLPTDVRTELTRIAGTDNRDLHAIDRLLDPSALRWLNPVGKRYIRTLGNSAYFCKRAVPDASPFQFGNVR